MGLESWRDLIRRGTGRVLTEEGLYVHNRVLSGVNLSKGLVGPHRTDGYTQRVVLSVVTSKT